MNPITRFRLATERMTRPQLERERHRIAREREHLRRPKHADELDEQEAIITERIDDLAYVSARCASL